MGTLAASERDLRVADLCQIQHVTYVHGSPRTVVHSYFDLVAVPRLAVGCPVILRVPAAIAGGVGPPLGPLTGVPLPLPPLEWLAALSSSGVAWRANCV